jgi:hypothetical protein
MVKSLSIYSITFGLCVVVVFGVLITPTFAQTRSTPRPTTTPSPTTSLAVPSQVPPTGIDLTVSPTFLNLVTNPGESVTSEIKIRNNNTFREYLEISIAKFQAADGGDRPLISDIEEGDEFARWVSFEESQFTVDPNENKTIKFTISPPQEASLGYYYAFIVNRIQQPTADGNQAIVSGAPALLVLLDVRSPNATRELELVSFNTDKPIYEYLPTTFKIRVKNKGNIHLSPVGDIFIEQSFGKTIAAFRANEGRANVLPQTEREFTATWNDGFAVVMPEVGSDGKTSYNTKYDFTKADKFRIGKYTANLVLVYDNGQRDIPLEASVTFWVIPWKIIGGAFIILLLAGLGLKGAIASAVGRIRR